MEKCGQSGCSEVATSRTFWPGDSPGLVCAGCLAKALGTAKAMGFHLHTEPLLQAAAQAPTFRGAPIPEEQYNPLPEPASVVQGQVLTAPNIPTTHPGPRPGSVVFFRISTSPPVLRPFLVIEAPDPAFPLVLSGIVFFSGDRDRGHEWCRRFAFFPPSKEKPFVALDRVQHGEGLGQWTARIPEEQET